MTKFIDVEGLALEVEGCSALVNLIHNSILDDATQLSSESKILLLNSLSDYLDRIATDMRMLAPYAKKVKSEVEQ